MSKPQILIGGELLDDVDWKIVTDSIQQSLLELHYFILSKNANGDWVNKAISDSDVENYLRTAVLLKRLRPDFPFREDLDWSSGEPKLTVDVFANGRMKI